MRVAREFHADEAAETHVSQCGHDARHVEATLAEGKMDVLARPHVLDLDVGEVRRVDAHRFGGVTLAIAPHVADIEGEPQRRVADLIAEADPVGKRGRVHPGFRFERGHESALRRLLGDGHTRSDHATVQLRPVGVRRRGAAPERDDVCAEIAADIHAPDEHVTSARALGVLRIEDRRTVLSHRVEEESCARLDADAQPPALEVPRDGRDLGGRGAERIEVLDVGRQSEAVVAEVGDEVNRLVEAVVRQSVGVVREAQTPHRRRDYSPGRTAASVSTIAVTTPISFVPGPSHVRDEILAAMATAPVPHRSDAFRQVVRRVQRGLGLLLQTGSPVFPVLGSATGAVELALRGVARQRVLILTNGSFGERMAAIASSLALDVETLALPAGDAVEPGLVARALDAGSFDTVGVVHVETSTGVVSDVFAIADVVRTRPRVALIVDAVSSLGGVDIAFDRLGPEAVLVSATGKALACPPGMAIVAAAPEAVERARSSERAGFALNLARLAEFHGKGDVAYTPNAALFHALDRQLPRILTEGMPAREARHREMAARVQSWASERFALLARDGARAPTVTAIENTRGLDVTTLLAAVERRGFRIADGHGALAGATFRIGHMGDVTMEETDALLAAVTEAVRDVSASQPARSARAVSENQ